MLFWLKKAATVPFLPLYFSLLAGFLGFGLLFRPKGKRAGRILIGVALGSLALASNKGVALLLIRPLESRYAPVPPAASAEALPPGYAACQAIVILGSGHSDDPGLSAVNKLSSSGLARLAEGVRLARLLPRARLIVSGYNGSQSLSHAQVLAAAAESLGVSSSRITRFDDTRDTDDEAQEIKRTLGAAPFILVTSAWHMPRAMALCRKADLHPCPAPADFLLRPGADKGWALFGFDLGALERSTKAIHERLGLFWAQLRGRA